MGESCGNATKAAKAAGYRGSPDTLRTVGAENLAKPNVRQAIEQRQENDPLVLNREKLQVLWSNIANDETVSMTHRLKATELLARSKAMFTERQIVEKAPGPTDDEKREMMRPLLGDPEALDSLDRILKKLNGDFRSGTN